MPQFKRTEADTGSPEVQIAQVRREPRLGDRADASCLMAQYQQLMIAIPRQSVTGLFRKYRTVALAPQHCAAGRGGTIAEQRLPPRILAPSH